MSTPRSFATTFKYLAVLLAAALLLAGCSTLKRRSQGTTAKQTPSQATRYHDFEDVLIPQGLEVERDESFIFQTTGMTAGVLALKGRVELHSLIVFFEKNMAKDNWRQIASFKSPRTMMLFNKHNRWCVISIRDGEIFTTAEIWVSPADNPDSGGLLR